MARTSICGRASALNLAGHLYRRHDPYGPDVCVYCGDPATTEDHVTPLHYVASLGDLLDEMRPRLRHGLLIVPACKDCNCRLGSYVAFSVTDKRRELQRRLRSRNAKLLASYDWQPEELADIGYSLQSHIRGREEKRRHVLARLDFPRPWETCLLRAPADLQKRVCRDRAHDLPISFRAEDDCKECRRCRRRLLLDSFSRKRRSRDGRHSWCKDCCRDYRSNRHEAAE